jgi:hypothetical protein
MRIMKYVASLLAGITGLIIGAVFIVSGFSVPSPIGFFRILLGVMLMFSGFCAISLRWKLGWILVAGSALFFGLFINAALLVTGKTLNIVDTIFTGVFCVIALVIFLSAVREGVARQTVKAVAKSDAPSTD